MNKKYNSFKVSPTDGESRIYSSREIAEKFGLSAQLLNKFLVKEGILIKCDDKHQYYTLSDSSLGEECHYNVYHRYDSEKNENTTNVSIKFSELGKDFIEYLLEKKCKIDVITEKEVDDDILVKYFPDGQFALTIRKPGTLFNKNPNNSAMIYISYRKKRLSTDKFSKDYMFISDTDAKTISKEFTKWGKKYHYLTKGYKLPVRDESLALVNSICNWKDMYFDEVLSRAGYSSELTNNQKKYNLEKMKSYLNEGE